ncbi:MAG: hypothetical protein KGQ59_08095 [Bdellovibrionales bacterium]|nr:hypothetical protein [Bdellovibrionales bacterium]
MSRVGCLVFSDSLTPSSGEMPAELGELFLRLSPVIALRRARPWAIFLDFRGFDTNDSGFQKTIALKSQTLLRRWGTADSIARSSGSFRIGFAENAAFALLAACYSQKLQAPLSPEILEILLDPFATEPKNKKPSAGQTKSWIQLLQNLGIHRLQDFMQLPVSSLASRFGKKGLEFSRRLQGAHLSADFEAWPLFIPTERLLELREFAPDQPLPAALEPLLFILKELLDRLCARLRSRLLRASQIQLTLQEEGNRATHQLQISFCTPQGSASGMLPSFRERLSTWLQKNETTESQTQTQLYGRDLLSVKIEVTETAPGHRSQRDFFHQHEEQAENWDSLLSRLSEKIGRKSTFQAKPVKRHLPEKSWTTDPPQFSPIETDPQLEIFPARPTRLLSQSIPLEHLEGWLRWPDTQEHLGRKKRVLRWIGPERICEGWWEQPSPEQEPQRDYFRVICSGGVQIWGYFETHSTQQNAVFFLQGYFD